MSISKGKLQIKYQYMLWGDKDETVDHIVSKSSKLVQKQQKTKYDFVREVSHWEWYKYIKIQP